LLFLRIYCSLPGADTIGVVEACEHVFNNSRSNSLENFETREKKGTSRERTERERENERDIQRERERERERERHTEGERENREQEIRQTQRESWRNPLQVPRVQYSVQQQRA